MPELTGRPIHPKQGDEVVMLPDQPGAAGTFRIHSLERTHSDGDQWDVRDSAGTLWLIRRDLQAPNDGGNRPLWLGKRI